MKRVSLRSLVLCSTVLALALGVAWPALGEVLQLTPGSEYGQRPSLSGTGTIVAFESTSDLTGGNSDYSWEVFLVNSDGTGLRQLSSDPAYDSRYPSIDAAGSAVAFQSEGDPLGGNADHSSEIFVINTDGTGLRQLTSGGTWSSWLPVVNAAGSVVSFSSAGDLTGGNAGHYCQLFVINSDGTGLRQLTNASDAGSWTGAPSLNAAGSVVVFESWADLTGGNADLSYEVFAVNSDGTGLRQLTDDATYSSRAPSLSSAGSVVAFQSTADLTGGNADHSSEIFVINTDGTGLQQLTSESNAAYSSEKPSCSAAGSVLAFQSDSDLTGENPTHAYEVFVVNSIGTGLRQVTNSGDSAYWTGAPSMDSAGSAVAFESEADLTGGNGGHVPQVFLATVPAMGEALFELWRGSVGGAAGAVSVNPSDGSVWVATVSSVIHLAADGSQLSVSSGFSSPGSVAVDWLDGSCWVADTGNDQVVHLLSDGTEAWRSAGSPTFNGPASVSVNLADGSCWVADTGNNQVVHLLLDRTEAWRSAGSPTFSGPASVVVDSVDGSCWVADTGNDQVVHLLSDGTETWRSAGSPTYNGPASVSVNLADGSCWVADAGNNRVVHLDQDGSQDSAIDGLSSPASVSVDHADDSCWVGDPGNQRVAHLDDDAEQLSDWGAFSAPCSVSGDPYDGSCWVADTSDEVVHLGVDRSLLTVDPPSPPTLPHTGGETSLNAWGAALPGHSIASWFWSDGGAGGSFSPSAGVRNPIYTAPENAGAAASSITLTVTLSYTGATSFSVTGATTLTVWPGVGRAELSGGSLPTEMIWEELYEDASLSFTNRGSSAWEPGAGYQLLSSSEFFGLDIWGSPSVLLGASVRPGATASFDFTITAPPITTLVYEVPVSPSDPAVTDQLDCAWEFSRVSYPVDGGGAASDPGVTVSRFSDIQPSMPGAWARTQIEECAGRVPFIVQGYGGGTYQPTWDVTRGQMAVFISRAAGYADDVPVDDEGNPIATFPDVPTTYWAFTEVERCVLNGVVQGYPDGLYRPGVVVTRDQMAVYIQRAAGFATSPVTGDPFPDVPADHWAAAEILACIDNDVVQGYPDGLYRPAKNVTRDQMAVFIYRAFVQFRDAVVVLAGPAVTTLDSWSSIPSGPVAEPGYVCVGLDIFRLDDTSDLTVKFELRSDPAVAAVDPYFTEYAVGAADIQMWRSVCEESGSPYLWCGWAIPAGLDTGSYTLITTLNGMEVLRKPTFEITP